MVPLYDLVINEQPGLDVPKEIYTMPIGIALIVASTLTALSFLFILICIKCFGKDQILCSPQHSSKCTRCCLPSFCSTEPGPLPVQEPVPTIYHISPPDLPPPPPYESLTPPSYDEALKEHRASLRSQPPLTLQPIATEPVPAVHSRTVTKKNGNRNNDSVNSRSKDTRRNDSLSPRSNNLVARSDDIRFNNSTYPRSSDSVLRSDDTIPGYIDSVSRTDDTVPGYIDSVPRFNEAVLQTSVSVSRTNYTVPGYIDSVNRSNEAVLQNSVVLTIQ